MCEADVSDANPGLETMVVLPGGGVKICDTADAVFKVFRKRDELFIRGGVVVKLGSENSGRLGLEVVRPAAFCSLIETIAPTFAWRVGREGKLILKPTPCPEETARKLLESHVARKILQPVNAVVGCSLLFNCGDHVEVAVKGYHAPTGTLVVAGDIPPEMPLEEAVALIESIFADFLFVTPSDRTRAIAAILTPALKLGGFIPGSIPADVAEADKSQAGKGYRHKLAAAVYNETPAVVVRRDGGVGGLDESFAAQLVAGRPFIQLDNLRGKFRSEAYESFMTAEKSFPCRLPGLPQISVDPSKFIVMVTSNGVETTPDAANRSSIVRIRKQAPGYPFRTFPEGDILQHIRANQARFLGAVITILREWHKAGRLKSRETGHDFREWACTLGGIMRSAFPGEGPLLEGHRSAQERVANPALTFLRVLAIAVEEDDRTGEALTASELREIAQEHEIDIPGLVQDADDQKAAMAVGRNLGRAFGKTTYELAVDDWIVTKTETPVARDDNNGTFLSKAYTFKAIPQSPQPPQ